jgi:hypothetical protein
VASALEEQDALNQPSEKFKNLHAHFTINLDKTSVLANDGNIRVIGAADRKKHEKNVDDSRTSITIVRIGSASGTSGPWIFLANTKRMDCKTLLKLEAWGAPPQSSLRQRT